MAATKVVAFLPPGDPLGSPPDALERWVRDLARAVVERSRGGFRFEIVSVAGEPGRRVISPGVTVRRLRAAGRPKDPLDTVSWEIPEAFADADLVHLHQAYTRGAEVGLLVAKQQRKPVCVTDHGARSSPLVRQLGALDLADRVIAHSDYGASLFRTRAPVTVIKGGVDSSRFSPAESSETRDSFLFIGPLMPHKGVDRLIEALPPDLSLTVCGEPRGDLDFSRLRSLAEGKCVEFIPVADEAQILSLYRRARATVFPTVEVDRHGKAHEAPELSVVPLQESMACGTPVLASRVGALPEFVEQGVNGFLFDDFDELTARLRTLADEPGLADRMGRRGRLLVERDYDLRLAARAILDVYEDLIDASAGSEMAA